MKRTTLLTCFLSATYFMCFLETTRTAAGEEYPDSGGLSSYSIGQFVTITTMNSNGSLSADNNLIKKKP